MICPECHAKVPDQFSFCPQCGLQVKAIQPDVAEKLSEFKAQESARQSKRAARIAAKQAKEAEKKGTQIPPQQTIGNALDRALSQTSPQPAQQTTAPHQQQKQFTAPEHKPWPVQQQPQQQSGRNQVPRVTQLEAAAAASLLKESEAAKQSAPVHAPKPEPAAPKQESAPAPAPAAQPAPAPVNAPNNAAGNQPEQASQKYANNQEPRWKQKEREAAAAAVAAAVPQQPTQTPQQSAQQTPQQSAQQAPQQQPNRQQAPAAQQPASPSAAANQQNGQTPVPPAPPTPPVSDEPVTPAPAEKQSSFGKFNAVLCALLALNLAGGGFLITKMLTKKDDPKPADSQVAMVDETTTTTTAETTTTTEATTTTTTKATTSATTTERTTTTPKTTTESTAPTTEPTTSSTTATTKTEPQTQQVDKHSAAQYYKDYPGVAFKDNANDPFCPPNLYTRASNFDGKAIQEATAKNTLAGLPVKWIDMANPIGVNNDDTQFRYVTNAYPVPTLGFSLPAAIDLYIHEGVKPHGNYLRRIDYYFGNHQDDRSGYTWTKDELYSVFTKLNANIKGRLGNGTRVNDSSEEHYRYTTSGGGSVDLFFYNLNGKYMVRLSRSNN